MNAGAAKALGKVIVMNIVDQILFQGRYHPPAAAICAPGTGIGLVSYGRLALYINNISAKLLALGLSRGDVVAVFVSDTILHATLILALMRLGIASVSVPDGVVPPGLNIKTVIADKTPVSSEAIRVAVADPSLIDGDGKPTDPRQLATDVDQEICRIILTSGTTGAPKAVAITHRMLADRIRRNGSILGPRFPVCSRIFCDLSLGTSFGFQFLVQTLLRGGMAIFAGSTLENTFKAFENYQVECWLTVPSGLSQFLRLYEEFPHYPSHLQAIISVGDVLSKSLAERVLRRICPHLISGYGSTEMSLTATALFHAISDIPGAVGYLAPGCEVQIVDEAGVVLPVGRHGSIRIRSPYGVDRYLGNPEETAKVFRDGWFYPGDGGELTRDSILVVSGRQSDVLNLGGEKIDPQRIEQVLCTFPEIADAAVVSESQGPLDEQVVVALVVSRAEIDERKLQEFCAERLAQPFVPARVLRVASIPRTPAGKIDRTAVNVLAKGQC
jgi:acyl-coenzyme A synthetase/AMP-(fatty) acid ligase